MQLPLITQILTQRCICRINLSFQFLYQSW